MMQMVICRWEGLVMKTVMPLFKNTLVKLKIIVPNINKKHKVLLILLLLLCLIFTAAAVIVYQIKSRIDQMMIPPSILSETRIRTETRVQSNEQRPPSESVISSITSTSTIDNDSDDDSEDLYFLIMGLDYREGHNALLTDTLLVMHIIPENSTIKMLSVPRDLIVTNASGHRVKINSLFYEGYIRSQRIAAENPALLTGEVVRVGPVNMDKALVSGAMANTRNKIEEILDIYIDHMVLVNFETVVALVDAVGGIEVQVKRSMELSDVGLFLEPGVRTLTGNEALGYARFRKDTRGSRYNISDFERVKNQQDIIKALAKKILSWNSSTKALEILDIIADNVKTDLNYSSIYSMIKDYYRIFNPDSFVSVPFPEHYTADGQVTIPEEALARLRDVFRDRSD